MSLPKNFLDEIRARLPLSEIAGKRVRLTRAGREFKACCPFHKEKTASFTINDQKGFYHCFGCGAHGDVFSFLMEHDNLQFMEAVEQLAGLAGMEVPKPSPQEAQRFEKQKSLYDLLEAATQWFEAQLRDGRNAQALQYLEDRGLERQVIADFRIGFAPDDGGALRAHLKQQGYEDADMIEVGLVRKSNYNKDMFGFFRNRIIFPVIDARKRVVAFGGRILPPSWGGPDDSVENPPPKYLNSPDSPVFHKGRLVYARHDIARQAAYDGQPLIFVEGYMDVIALVRAGFNGAVAPLGTALTESQILAVWKMAPEENRVPVLCFDGDTAGQRAALRVLDRVLPILQPDHSVRFAFLPSGEDPDSLLKAAGPKAVRKVLDNTASLFEMLWNAETHERDFDTPEAQAGLKARLEKRVGVIEDRSVQEFYLNEIRKRIDETFRHGYRKSRGDWKKGGGRKWKGHGNEAFAITPQRPSRITLPSLGAGNSRIRILVATLVNYPEIFDDVAEKFGMMDIPDKNLDRLRHEIVDALSLDPTFDTEALQLHLSQAGHEKTLAAALDKTVYLHAGFARPGQSVEAARKGWLDTWERIERKQISA